MTWYYDLSDDGSSMDIYEDDPEFTGLVKTVENDGSGFQIPNDVLDSMSTTFMQVVDLGENPTIPVRAGWIVVDLTTNNVVEGTPE